MSLVHHTALCVRDIEQSLRFWRDGLGFQVLMDEQFEGDWRTLLRADTTSLRSVFLGDPSNAEAGIVELVDFAIATPESPAPPAGAVPGFLLVSIMTDLERALTRLEELGLGGVPRRVKVFGVAMAVVLDPDGVQVELIDTPAMSNLERLTETEEPRTETEEPGAVTEERGAVTEKRGAVTEERGAVTEERGAADR